MTNPTGFRCIGYNNAGKRCGYPIIPVAGSLVHPTCSEHPHGAPEVDRKITEAVNGALRDAGGDPDQAIEALKRLAVVNVMDLFEQMRATGRLTHTRWPELPAILRKPAQGRTDAIWEGRHQWLRPNTPDEWRIVQLDVNGAYLGALNTHLPIGTLENTGPAPELRGRSGFYLITLPAWDEAATGLPAPWGARREGGPVWVGRPTLQLIHRAARDNLCTVPDIEDSWTAKSTEALFRKLQGELKFARAISLLTDDEVMLEYIKAMYSRLVSTMGESTANRGVRHPDWMHLIRSQAFANLWLRAQRVVNAGGTVYRLTGTDELHLLDGNAHPWRDLWHEGRELTHMKVKGVYVIGDKREKDKRERYARR